MKMDNPTFGTEEMKDGRWEDGRNGMERGKREEKAEMERRGGEGKGGRVNAVQAGGRNQALSLLTTTASIVHCTFY